VPLLYTKCWPSDDIEFLRCDRLKICVPNICCPGVELVQFGKKDKCPYAAKRHDARIYTVKRYVGQVSVCNAARLMSTVVFDGILKSLGGLPSSPRSVKVSYSASWAILRSVDSPHLLSMSESVEYLEPILELGSGPEGSEFCLIGHPKHLLLFLGYHLETFPSLFVKKGVFSCIDCAGNGIVSHDYTEWLGHDEAVFPFNHDVV
jgi:hypothetical protein